MTRLKLGWPRYEETGELGIYIILTVFHFRL